MNDDSNQPGSSSSPTGPQGGMSAGDLSFNPNIEFILNRAKEVFLDPKGTWEKVKDEPIEVKDFLLNFILPLALFSAACNSILVAALQLLFGGQIYLMYTVTTALFGIVTTVVGIYILALIFEKLAPSFGGQTTIEDTLKLVGYSFAPGALAQVIQIVPLLGSLILFIIGLYSLYIMYSGLPAMTRVPDTRKLGYMIVNFVLMIVFYFLLAIASRFLVPRTAQYKINASALEDVLNSHKPAQPLTQPQ